MPIKTVKGKRVRILPVAFIHHPAEQAEPTLVYAMPESVESPIPETWCGYKTHRKKWEGGAPKATQDLAKKLFMERKK